MDSSSWMCGGDTAALTWLVQHCTVSTVLEMRLAAAVWSAASTVPNTECCSVGYRLSSLMMAQCC
jgi:hypothetical protein